MSDNETSQETTSVKIGGKKIPCTREEFDEEIQGRIYSQCDLKDVGTFYFLFDGDKPVDERNRWRVSLNFYNEQEEVRHTISVFTCLRTATAESVALNQNLFMLSDYIIALDKEWNHTEFHKLNDDTKTLMTDVLLDQTSVHKTGLSRIRKDAASDFILKPEQGKDINVHKSVMEGLWPFFKGMLDSNMKEAAEGFVKFPMPGSTLNLIVQYFYGEKLSWRFEDAANLIVFAQMYDLGELLEMATVKVKRRTLTIEQAVLLWQKGFEANNEEVRDFATGHIKKLMAEVDDFEDKINHLEKNQLVCLLQDLSQIMSNKRRKLEEK